MKQLGSQSKQVSLSILTAPFAVGLVASFVLYVVFQDISYSIVMLVGTSILVPLVFQFRHQIIRSLRASVRATPTGLSSHRLRVAGRPAMTAPQFSEHLNPVNEDDRSYFGARRTNRL